MSILSFLLGEKKKTAGIAKDSVTRLLSILQQSRFPSMFGRTPQDRLFDQGSVFGSFDFNPPFSSSGQTFNITTNGSWNKQAPAGMTTAELPTFPLPIFCSCEQIRTYVMN